MEKKLQEFFAAYQAKEKEEALKKKEAVLIACGLYNEEREYSDKRGWGDAKYDAQQKKYYRIKKVPIEVTEEEYRKILEIHQSTAAPVVKKEEENIKIRLEEANPAAERILNFLIKMQLIVAIILAVVMLIAGFEMNKSIPSEAPWPILVGILLAVIMLIIGLITWSLQKVVINISNNSHNISKLLQQKFNFQKR